MFILKLMAQIYTWSIIFNINWDKYNQSFLKKVQNATNYKLNVSKTSNRNCTLFKYKSCTSLVVRGVCLYLGELLD